MKQKKIVMLLLMASGSLYAMGQKDEKPFFCQKCGDINLNIRGNERDKFEICRHRCCRLCVCEARGGSRGPLRCPVCHAFSNKRDKCTFCVMMGTFAVGVTAMLAARLVYGSHVPK